MHILASMLRQRQAAGDMNKQTKTYYGGASEIAPVCWKVSVLEKRAQKGRV